MRVAPKFPLLRAILIVVCCLSVVLIAFTHWAHSETLGTPTIIAEIDAAKELLGREIVGCNRVPKHPRRLITLSMSSSPCTIALAVRAYDSQDTAIHIIKMDKATGDNDSHVVITWNRSNGCNTPYEVSGP